MFVIGITGSLATGKSTAAQMLRKQGAVIISADKIAHEVIKPEGACFHKTIKKFGKSILTGGRIDHKKLAEIVFHSPAKRKTLERIIHPHVEKTIKGALRRYKRTHKKIVLDVPLLFESGLNKYADLNVVVKAAQYRQIERVRKVRKMSKADALRRIRAQMPLRKKIRLADLTIDNNGTIKQTEKQVRSLWQKL